MSRLPFRLSTFVAGAGILISALGATSSGAANAPRVVKPFRTSVQRAQRPLAGRLRATRKRQNSPSGCSANYSVSTNGTEFFLGVTSASLAGSPAVDIAGGENSAVLGGASNEACDQDTGIGGGNNNIIGGSSIATESFIGGGMQNQINGNDVMIGSGGENVATGDYGFIGAGEYNVVGGQAASVAGGVVNINLGNNSFIGTGGYDYLTSGCGGSVCSANNMINDVDAFVGAGDLNLIASGGAGSFIGAGGTVWALSGNATAGNQISGVDSFIGAGDQNNVSGQQSFIGAGADNGVTANYGFVGSGTYNKAAYYSSVVGGGGNNASGAYSFIGGGGDSLGNLVSGTAAFVGAGDGNSVSGKQGFVGAGSGNRMSATGGFIGAGTANTIVSAGTYASIIGGLGNTASGTYSSVIGGYKSVASGAYAIVAGGNSSTASGTLTFAAGYHANAVNNGSFVWSDYKSGSTVVKDTATNQFVVRASGGTTVYSNEGATSGVSLAAGSGTWASLSDRNAKTDVVPLDDASILAKVSALPISAWQYTSERGVRHVGPMAQDFYAAFGTGADDRHITSIDEDGVALAAIKALHRENGRLRRDVATLRAETAGLPELRAELRLLEARVATMAQR